MTRNVKRVLWVGGLAAAAGIGVYAMTRSATPTAQSLPPPSGGGGGSNAVAQNQGDQVLQGGDQAG